MKVYVRAPFSEEGLAQLGTMFTEVVYEPWTNTGERFYEDEMLENLLRVQPDALITELDRITKKVLEGYDRLRFIGDCRGTPANIETEACEKAGVSVICTPGRNTQAVAEMVVALILAFYRKILPSVQWAREGGWIHGTTPYYLWMGHELQGKKVGLVGFGRISRALAKILNGFDCDISFYDPFVEQNQGNCHKKTLEEVFAQSDIVSLHLPVLESTKGMITEELLRSMKPEAIFVNAARSALVDYEGLKRVLCEKKIAGAIIDVLDTEPPTSEDAAWATYERVLLTPHICGATYEVTDHQSEILIDGIRRWMKENGKESR